MVGKYYLFAVCKQALHCVKNVNPVLAARTIHTIPTKGKIANSDLATQPNTNVETSEEAYESIRLKKIKRVLKEHFHAAEKDEKFLEKKEHEFQIGKRHLANMMGMDAETMTQKDIDTSIEYLMPSGLFEPRARPVMKPAREMFPPPKGMEFDATGRPLNTFFYTGIAMYYNILHDLASKLEELNKFEDKMLSKGFAAPPPETIINLEDSDWILLEALGTRTMEPNLKVTNYNYFISSMERLVAHPYSYRVKDFINQFRVPKIGATRQASYPPLTVDEDGVPYATAIGKRKGTRAVVTVRGRGSGAVDINGHDISFFKFKQDREQLLFPLKFSGLLNEVDFQAVVTGNSGHTAEANSIRHGLSLALGSFVSSETAERMRLAGLMDADKRTRERSHYGHKGAREGFNWSKR